MYTVVTNWRIAEATRPEDAYATFLLEAGKRVVPILRDHGMLDVFVIRISDEVVKFINIYEDRALADGALAAVQSNVGAFLEQHLELLERSGGETIDLPALFGDLPV